MILSLVKYFNGGIDYEYLVNVPIYELLEKHETATRINAIEKRESN